MKKRFSITLDSDILEKLDKKRGDINRSTYINSLLRKHLKNLNRGK